MVEKIEVSVLYADGAKPEQQFFQTLLVPLHTNIEEAIAASRLLLKFPHVKLSADNVGVFGQRCSLDNEVSAGDQIEVYRPLLRDPKLRRRQQAEKK